MSDPEELERMLDRPCSSYICDDADALAACVAELQDNPDSWQTMHEAAIEWAGHSVPYALVVHDDALTLILGNAALNELSEEELGGLADAAVQYFAIELSGKGGHS